MALTHLLDTSVLTRLHRAQVRAAIEALSTDGEVARPQICDLEIGYGARTVEEWDGLMGALQAFAPLPVHAAQLTRALQVQRLLAERHQRGRKLPDLIVAACAEANGLVVLHYDADFDRIAAVTGQPVEWVVPAGSVD